MIASSGKQKVETFFVRHMQVYMFVIEILQKSKYHYPALSLAHSIFFFFKCTSVLCSGKKNVILTKAYGQSQSKMTAVSRNVDQAR